MTLTIARAFIVLVLGSLPSLAQHATREDFIEFVHAMSGRWFGERSPSPARADQAKSGETTITFVEGVITENGNVFTGRVVHSKSSSTAMVIYDAAARQIKETGASSGGAAWTTIYFKEGGGWKFTLTGSQADGTRFEAKGRITISASGDTQTWVDEPASGDKPPANTPALVLRRAGK